MNRIERIRKRVVAKAIATDGWWEDHLTEKWGVADMFENGQLGRHLLRHTGMRKRQTVQRLLDLSIRDFED